MSEAVSKTTPENNWTRELITTSENVALDFCKNGQTADAVKAASDFLLGLKPTERRPTATSFTLILFCPSAALSPLY